MSDLVVDDIPFGSDWLEAVSTAIGLSIEDLKELIQTWLTLGKTAAEMEQRLTMLAMINGKTLVFAKKTNLS